jgi:hypothetical protein
MALQLTNVSNALKTVILPYIKDNLPKQAILLDQIKRNSGTTFQNGNFYAPVRSGRHYGITNLANDGSTLRSGYSSIGQASVANKIMTGTFDITKLTLDATETKEGAVQNMLTFQADTLMSDMAKDLNRQFMGDGIGVLSEVVGSVGAGTMSIGVKTASNDDGRTIDNYGTVNGDISPSEYLFVGMGIGIGTAGADVGTISSITGNTVVMTGAPAIAANDAIYRVDGDEGGAGTSEITGMRAALSSSTGTSTYAGLARSTTGWTPQVGTTSEALTLSAMESKYLAAKKYAQTGDRYAIFTNITLYKKYGDILTSMRRSVDSTDLLGGWTGLEFAAGAGKVGVFLDYDVTDGEVLILNLDTFTIAQVSDLSWSEEPGTGSLLRQVNTLKYQATMHWFMNLLCLCPAANGRLTQKTA